MRLALLLLTALVITSSASGLLYEVKGVKTRVFPEEPLEYRIGFYNNEAQFIQIYLNKFVLENTFGQVDIKPSWNVYLNPNETVTLNLTITPKANTIAGEYLTPLFISYKDITERLMISSTVLGKSVEPVKLQNLTLLGTYSTDPRNAFNITGAIVSNAELIYPQLSIIISDASRIIHSQSSIISFNSGINEFEREVKLDNLTLPGTYSILIEALVNGVVITQSAKTLTVTGYQDSIRSESVTEDFFGKRVIKSVNNSGNTELVVSLNYSTNYLESLLITGLMINYHEKGRLIADEFYSINDFTNLIFDKNVTLNPSQGAGLTVNVSYLPLSIIPFGVLIIILLWALLNKKAIIRKEIIMSEREGKELVVKVIVRVKNIGFKPITEGLIIESLPMYIKKIGDFGSIKGEVDKVKRLLKFDCGTLHPKEEVLVSFKFKSDVELVGRVELPPSTFKFKHNRRMHEIKGNSPIIEFIKGGEP